VTRGEPGLAVYLLMRGRRVLVVGGGRVAAAKVAKLLAAHAEVVVVAPALTSDLAGRAGRREIAWLAREFEADDVADVWFVVAATGNPAVDRAVFAACEARRVWCNAADVPAACSTFWMAQRQAGDAVVAAGTGGAAPGLAGRIADEALAGLPGDLAALVDHYAQTRAAVLASVPGDGPEAHVRTKALRRLARRPWAALRAAPGPLTSAVVADIATELGGAAGPSDDGDGRAP